MNTNMTFGDAIAALKDDKRVARECWNGKGMWLVLLRPGDGGEDAIITSHVDPVGYFDTPGDELPVDPVIAMKTAGNTLQPGWLASQADILSEDWQLVN